jgi:cell division protein ZapD
LRISLAGSTRLYPEVSGSHHRCSLRFLRWNSVHSRPVQATENVSFVLATCS